MNESHNSDAVFKLEEKATGSAEVERLDEARFTREMEQLVQKAEALRLGKMQSYRTRKFIASASTILFVLGGASGFGWFFLVQSNLLYAIGCIALGALVPIITNIWSEGPLKSYHKNYKSMFLPRLAKVVGNMRYSPSKGISAKTLARTGIIPPHKHYHAEDCFIGRYKNVKIILSEARLARDDNHLDLAFDGIFALMEIKDEKFSGQTIITADDDIAALASHDLQGITLTDPHFADRFNVFTSAPQELGHWLDDKLLKELSEMVSLFDNAALSAVFFNKRYIFVMIPYSIDMFEPSHISVPVSIRQHALQCKKEIEQLLSIIDVLELYKNKQSTS